MAVRPIDGNELLKKFAYSAADTEDEQIFNAAARKIIRDLPTLTPPNAPLALDELREMDGEPVYIHSDIFPEDCGWRVIARADVLRIYFTDRTSLSLTDYGKSWIAYRRPKEEQ